jgi:hypothetical protein
MTLEDKVRNRTPVRFRGFTLLLGAMLHTVTVLWHCAVDHIACFVLELTTVVVLFCS